MKRSLSLVAFLTLALLVTGCAQNTPKQSEGAEPAPAPKATTTTDATPTTPMAQEEKKKPASVKAQSTTAASVKATAPVVTVPVVEPAVKKFSITAQNWSFSPSTITVNKGDKVELSIKSVDVNHGFFLSAFSVNKQLKPGETVTASFTADKAGSFSFVCSVFCGSGHPSMSGTLIVK